MEINLADSFYGNTLLILAVKEDAHVTWHKQRRTPAFCINYFSHRDTVSFYAPYKAYNQ